MSSISRAVLNAGAASAVGEVVDCTGLSHVFFWIKTVTTADFTGTNNVQFAALPDASVTPAAAPVMLVANMTSNLIALPTGYAVDATNAQVNILATGSSTQMFLVRIANPPQYVVPRFNYGAGGGAAPQVSVAAYGFSILPR